MPGAQRDADRTRSKVLEAAATAIGDQGPGVSLDLIARRAGVSKGGLLHHFPSREHLIAALMQRQRDEFRERLDRELGAEPEGIAGRYTRAYVRAVFAEVTNAHKAREQWTLLGMVGTNGSASRFLREADEQRVKRVAEDGIDPMRAEVVMSAAFGTTARLLWSHEIPGDYQKLCDILLAMASETGPFPVASAS